jgi:diguanylate cyclase (GGDEF)-like protein/putative nucleotidyltransferase with HDIG domain
MGDVFTIVVLMNFGPGAALLTYWADIVVAHLTDAFRKQGFSFWRKALLYRWAFNLACCALSTWTMYVLYDQALSLPLAYPLQFAFGLLAVALGWFAVNTGTLSLAISFLTRRSFWEIWREGITLYLLNFIGSAAAAGLVSVFYQRAGFLIFLLCLPIAVVLYQLYLFYIQKYDQAQNHIQELNKLYLQTVEALAGAVDAKDRYTHGHVRRVQTYATTLAHYVGVRDPKELLAIEAGALLHDIGKIAIPEYILNKPTVLTETEFEKMKIHPVVGANMLKTIDFPYPVVPIVRSHHERWDGKGYPEGLKQGEIPLGARILALVDCYDALTTNRPYRSPMDRPEVVEFFRRESAKAYDPTVVDTFIQHLEEIEAAAENIKIDDGDVWGIKEEGIATPNVRKLEKVQPTISYGRALSGGVETQRELYSVFEFTRAEIQCLTAKDVFTFMGLKLSNLIEFDAAVFYTADGSDESVTAAHVVGTEVTGLLGLRLGFEQKLTGWVAANNQSLCNLPPFPDFLKCDDPKPTFQLSAIAPMNRDGKVFGAISLYRKTNEKFPEEAFRRLEIIASQAAIALSKCGSEDDETSVLTDSLTGLPNGFQLYLMFDQIAMDAQRYEYPLALFSIHIDNFKGIRQRWGHLSGDAALRAAANYLSSELRETDLLIRYGLDEFVALNPRMNWEQAEALRSRLQNDLDHFHFAVRSDVTIALPVSVGLALYPGDGSNLEALLSVANWRLREDRELRVAVRRRVRSIQAD